MKLFRYTCPKCGEFEHMKKGVMLKHMEMKHDLDKEESLVILKPNEISIVKNPHKHKLRSCTFCAEHFYSYEDLEQHVRENHDENWSLDDMLCKFCKKEFVKIEFLKEHPCYVKIGIIDILDRSKEPFTCLECKDNHQDVDELKKHYLDNHADAAQERIQKQDELDGAYRNQKRKLTIKEIECRICKRMFLTQR